MRSVAPLMLEQLPPFSLHRRHWKTYVIGSVPVQVPVVPVSAWPCWAVPEIVGGAVFLGGAGAAASLTSARPAIAARTSSTPTGASNRSLFVRLIVRFLPRKDVVFVLSPEARARENPFSAVSQDAYNP